MNDKRNILLIDDSRKFAYQIQLILFTNGSTGSVEIATSLQEAEDIIKKNTRLLIIADIKVGGETTLDLIRKARKSVANISVIVLTNHFDEMHRLYAHEAGADFFIDKALAFQDLPRVLAQAHPAY